MNNISGNRTLDNVLSQLKGVKRCSNGWQAYCPAHDDKKQSLHVSQGKDGRVLIHCHAGCSVDDVCASIGLTLKDLFPEHKPRTRSKVIAVYDYKDASGKLLFQVCRTPDKQFFQRRPDGKGGWVNGLGGVKPVLYHLPELLQAVQRGKTVFIPEGEKDVNNLVRQGLAATTNPMGAGKWRSEYSNWLQGVDVVILPDNDEPGRKHAEQVALSLQGKAKSIKILKLPDLPPKGDVSDWLAAGGNKEKLLELAAEAPEWEPASPEKSENTTASGGYKVQNDCIVWLKPTRDGVLPVTLSNFTARVVRDVSLDDGAEETRFFELEGALASGRPLPRIKVPADKFFSMNWLGNWGVGPIISAGMGAKDRVREAIQLFSSGAAQEKVFTHIGWRRINSSWAYLHAGGAIGCNGVLVEVETPTLQRYILPANGGDAKAGMEASLALLSVAPPEITLPLWAAVWRAPTASLLYPTIVLWLHGPTGSYKSTLASLLLSHYGGPFSKDNLPGSWLSTDNALERLCFLARDTLLVVDDYAPEQHPREAAALDKRVNRLVRQIGNRAARSRLGGDLRARPETPPNALVISTGEQLPLGVASVAARILPVLCEREKVNLEALSLCQAQAHKLAWAMRGYIEWLVPQMDELARELPRRFEELRAKATIDGHARLPEAVAHLHLGTELGLQFAMETGVIGQAQAEEIAQQTWNTLLALAHEHAGTLEEEKPAFKFLQILNTIFLQGKGHLVDRHNGDRPPKAWMFGWGYIETENGEGAFLRRGDLLGWADTEGLYLIPEAVWRSINDYVRSSGGFPVRERTLREMLARENILVRGENGRTTRSLRIEGVKRRVIHLDRDLYLSLLQKAVPVGPQPANAGVSSLPPEPPSGSEPVPLKGKTVPSARAGTASKTCGPALDPVAGSAESLATQAFEGHGTAGPACATEVEILEI